MRMAECHPDRKHKAKGLCQRCYANAKAKAWYNNNRGRARESQRSYYQTHREKLIAKQNAYNSIRKEAIRQYKREWGRKRINEDPGYKIKRYLRNRIYYALKGKRKVGSAVADLGCPIDFFRCYIESLWEPRMSWDNYGKWHLDHIVPLALFDMTDRQHFLLATNWRNYQPLWAIDNLRKGARTT